MIAEYDSEYERKRDALIPQAEIFATSQMGPYPHMDEAAITIWNDEWNRHFHFKMNELVRLNGI